MVKKKFKIYLFRHGQTQKTFFSEMAHKTEFLRRAHFLEGSLRGGLSSAGNLARLANFTGGMRC